MNRLNLRTAPIVAATLLLCLVPSTAKAASLSSGLIAPVASPQLVRGYLQPTSDYSAGHRGVDYRVSLGDAVVAATSGTVWFAGKVVNRSIVTLRDSSGNLIEVEPVCPTVTASAVVKVGDPIGRVCDADQNYRPHCEAMRCLHFSYRTPNGYLSPIWVMGQLAPSVLAPWSKV